MGNLRDQLKKANLISKKDARRLAHEERVHRKAVGGAAGVDAEKAEHEARLREIQAGQRDADRVQQAELQRQRDAAAEAAACEALLERESQKPGRRGASRWYLELADGRLPCLELPLSERMQLTDGSSCVVRVGPGASHDYELLAIEHGRRIVGCFPDRIVWAAAGALSAPS